MVKTSPRSPEQPNAGLGAFWQEPLPALLERLGTGPGGLTSAEAAARLASLGANVRHAGEARHLAADLLRFLANPLVAILLLSAIVAAVLGDRTDSVIVVVIVAMSVVLNAVQLHRSRAAVRALRERVAATCHVRRDGAILTIAAERLAPGDVFLLDAGDVAPADGRLLEATDLLVDQAILTGESLPAEKAAVDLPPAAEDLDEARNAVFAGTSVVTGDAWAVAVRTGNRTEVGRIAAELGREPPPTEFERSMAGFGHLILRVVTALVLFVFIVQAVFRREPLDAALFALALAVGITPELLPMIVTVALSYGAIRMARRRVIVKQLQAIENLGSVDVLCTDKTGTLTQGALRVEAAVDPFGKPAPQVLDSAITLVMHETSRRNPLDDAILAAASGGLKAGYTKVDETPFDFHRRRASVVVERDGRHVLLAKGAPEAVLEACESYRQTGGDFPLDSRCRDRIMRTFQKMSVDGLRVLAIAERLMTPKADYTKDDERGMALLGFVAFLDSPREDVPATIKRLEADGIRMVLLTGDNEWVARRVCAQVGIDASRLVTGHDLDRIRGEALPRVVERVSVFARVTPEQKERIVRTLKRSGHVVGFLGDGINDAPSLRAADVGISVAGAADVAREAAQIILLEKGLDILHDGIREGRRAFANVAKYLLMGTSSNFGNMLSMAVASVFLPFLPMLPTQILLNNLLYDFSQVGIPADTVDEADLLRPRRLDLGFLQRFIVSVGPISSLFDGLTFALLLGVFHAGPELFRTAWFVESLLTQTLVIFVIRTRLSILSGRPGWALALGVGLVCGAALVLPFSPAAQLFAFAPLPPAVLVVVGGLAVAYLGAVEGLKRLLFRPSAVV